MYSEDVKSISASLGELAGKIAEEHWEFIKIARMNLDALAQQIKELENTLELNFEEGAQ